MTLFTLPRNEFEQNVNQLLLTLKNESGGYIITNAQDSGRNVKIKSDLDLLNILMKNKISDVFDLFKLKHLSGYRLFLFHSNRDSDLVLLKDNAVPAFHGISVSLDLHSVYNHANCLSIMLNHFDLHEKYSFVKLENVEKYFNFSHNVVVKRDNDIVYWIASSSPKRDNDIISHYILIHEDDANKIMK